VPPFATVLETNGCAMPSVNLQHYSLNRPFEWVPTQNANNVEDSPTGRRMGVNRDFTAWEFWDWLHFPPAVFAKTRRPRSSYGRAYGRRVSAAAAIGKRSCLAHWGPDDTLTGQNSRDTPPLYLVPLARWATSRPRLAAKVTPSPQPGLGAYKGTLRGPAAKIAPGQVAGNSNHFCGHLVKGRHRTP
jgi:hypothetical protein